MPVETTLCNTVRSSDAAIFIDHASEDAVYRTHHTPRIYRIESYASVPIKLPNGEYFGNLCAIDARPHKVSEPRITALFELFAQLIALQLESDRTREQVQREPIPAGRLDMVFAPFWRRSASREGLGLGLYICSQIVKSHHGTLAATSTARDSTRFLARLPIVV